MYARKDGLGNRWEEGMKGERRGESGGGGESVGGE